MIEVELNGEVVQVNTELTIGQYQQFIKNKTIFEKEPARLLALYMNMDYSKLKNLPKKDVEFVQGYLNTELLKSEYNDETIEKFEFQGVEYGLINDWAKLAWGAWVDLEVFSSDNIEDNIHKIMSILYRPITGIKKGKYIIAPYNSDEIDERAELFKGLPISYWFGAANFFFLIGTIHTVNMQNSLNTKIKYNKLIMRGWEILPKWIKRKIPLDSILVSPFNSQTKTLPKLNK